MKFAAILAVAASTLALAAPALAQQQQRQVIHAGHLIRDAEGAFDGPATITVEGGRILSIEDGLQPAPAGAELIDLSDKTVMPGLIDLHVHLDGNPSGDFRDAAVESDEWATLTGAVNARSTLAAGFTTVRDMGSYPQSMFAVRRAVAEGTMPGPRILASGPPLAIIGGHGDVSGFRPEVNDALDTGFTCTGPAECAARVRQAAQNGSDWIKITATGGVLSQQGRGLEAHFTHAEMEAIVEVASALGLDVAAHAHGARGIEAAANAGISTIEHGTYLDPGALDAMAEHGTVLVPTLMAFQGVIERLDTGVYTPTVETKIRQVAEIVGDAVREARRRGITVAFGTDAGVFEHGRNAGEFALLTQAGLTDREAVASATTVAARVLHMEDEIGRLAPGYSADMIALDGNPLENAALLEDVDWAMAGGRALAD
ncbi:amidohydrolase family protein [Erythrobacter arachoides]|uniref:Amidohydrolase family protein n=1 Tax=Aurantiacibacter arachoides TaxID=1850444 RepID=A0A844ZZG7_9SPHN|nr:amidohydrolase family protein [Aurantiacibacter arachoides]MXO92127.1 amidohydrolase family protein [Aurantiacibacter arachoides]GGD59502.1 Xaa-Pro dipeptidase [Aurantiacibacter arachoides]